MLTWLAGSCHIGFAYPRNPGMQTKLLLGTVLALVAPASADTQNDSSILRSAGPNSEQWLMPGQTLTDSCFYRATMQYDGNFVLTDNGTQHPYWSTGTYNSGKYAKLQTDGNFVIYNWNDNPVWSTGTYNNSLAHAQIQDDGNFVVYNWNNQPIWATDTAYTERIGSTNCEGSNITKTQVYKGYDAVGGDYSRIVMPASRASWCAYYCSQDSRCKMFTYVPPGIQGSSPLCYLKDGAVTWGANSLMTSGVMIHGY